MWNRSCPVRTGLAVCVVGGGSCGTGCVLRRSLPICVVLSGTTVPKPPKRPLCRLVWRLAGPQARNGSADLLPLTAARSFLARQQARLPPPSADAAALRVQAGRPVASRPPSRPHGAARGTVRRYDNGSDRQLHPRRRRRLHRHDPHPQHQHQGDHPARHQGQRARPRPPGHRQRRRVRRGLEQDGARTPAPNTSRSSSTTLPSPARSTPPWSRATTASTSSSGRADRPTAPRH